jgi:hypothetical protein
LHVSSDHASAIDEEEHPPSELEGRHFIPSSIESFQEQLISFSLETLHSPSFSDK